eukprot:Hpha_TRINITY_DN29993_c0_g1::TRINITY_DN29993_c0_g1_i1::g.131778::m.131778
MCVAAPFYEHEIGVGSLSSALVSSSPKTAYPRPASAGSLRRSQGEWGEWRISHKPPATRGNRPGEEAVLSQPRYAASHPCFAPAVCYCVGSEKVRMPRPGTAPVARRMVPGLPRPLLPPTAAPAVSAPKAEHDQILFAARPADAPTPVVSACPDSKSLLSAARSILSGYQLDSGDDRDDDLEASEAALGNGSDPVEAPISSIIVAVGYLKAVRFGKGAIDEVRDVSPASPSPLVPQRDLHKPAQKTVLINRPCRRRKQAAQNISPVSPGAVSSFRSVPSFHSFRVLPLKGKSAPNKLKKRTMFDKQPPEPPRRPTWHLCQSTQRQNTEVGQSIATLTGHVKQDTSDPGLQQFLNLSPRRKRRLVNELANAAPPDIVRTTSNIIEATSNLTPGVPNSCKLGSSFGTTPVRTWHTPLMTPPACGWKSEDSVILNQMTQVETAAPPAADKLLPTKIQAVLHRRLERDMEERNSTLRNFERAEQRRITASANRGGTLERLRRERSVRQLQQLWVERGITSVVSSHFAAILLKEIAGSKLSRLLIPLLRLKLMKHRIRARRTLLAQRLPAEVRSSHLDPGILASSVVLGHWPEDALEELASKASLVVHEAGERIVSEGDPITALYVVAHGTYKVSQWSQEWYKRPASEDDSDCSSESDSSSDSSESQGIARVGLPVEGASTVRKALIPGVVFGSATATRHATGATAAFSLFAGKRGVHAMWTIPAAVMLRIAAKLGPEVREDTALAVAALHIAALKRVPLNSEALRRHDVLRLLPQQDQQTIADSAEAVFVPCGSPLFRMGDEPENITIVVRGDCHLHGIDNGAKQSEGEASVRRQVIRSRRDVLAVAGLEEAVCRTARRTVMAVAATNLDAWVVSRGVLARVLGRNASAASLALGRVLKVLARRAPPPVQAHLGALIDAGAGARVRAVVASATPFALDGNQKLVEKDAVVQRVFLLTAGRLATQAGYLEPGSWLGLDLYIRGGAAAQWPFSIRSTRLSLGWTVDIAHLRFLAKKKEVSIAA